MQQRTPTPLGVLVLTNADLQKELKITDDQKKELKELMTKAEDLNKKRAEAMSGGQPDREALQELQKSAEALAADVKKAGEKGFTDEQKKRIKQIDVQRMGLAAFTNEDVQKELKVTDDQKKTLKETADAYQKATRDLRTEIAGETRGRLDPEKQAELTKKTTALTEETMEKVMKAMTDDQKKAWKELTGEKFDVAKLQVRPMRRDN
jgi:outer membrane protein assembly factor BamE (lipoprotein component of BamABCDE complex)